MQYKIVFTVGLLAMMDMVAGHGAIISATGDAGGQGSAIGIEADTPRDGSRRRPFQQDATRFRGDAAASCGETLGGGNNNIEAGTAAVMAASGDQLPQITQGGSVEMQIHQINGDGAGPYRCMIDATGTGTNWRPIQVTQQVPGDDGDSDARAQAFPLTVAIPNNQQCTGDVAGEANVCMVRCENPANAGPFGGCIPVQMVQAASNATAGAAKSRRTTPMRFERKRQSHYRTDPAFLSQLLEDDED